MKLRKLQGEFETADLAELAAGRLRRSIRGIRQISVHRLGRGLESLTGRQKYTILPSNMRMMNYATAVMLSDISDDIHPEPFYQHTAELLVICEESSAEKASALLQAAGAMHVRLS